MSKETYRGASQKAIQHTIYWHETERVEYRSGLFTDLDVDICFIGGGYTALWTSHFLKKANPELKICILEADYVGCGGSGHNDGFVTPTIGNSLGMAVRQFGVDAVRPAYAAIERSIKELRRFVRKNGIDTEFEANGFYKVATSPVQRCRLEHEVAIYEQFGEGMGLRLEEGDEVRRSIPSAIIQSGIKKSGGMINPFKLCRGLGRAVESQGVEIYERSKVINVESDSSGHKVLTGAGSVRADNLVYATNAYQTEFDEFRNSLLPVWSYALVSDPLNDEQMEYLSWTERVSFVEAKNFVVFGRLTKDNRILIGGGPALYRFGRGMDERHMRNDTVEAYLQAQAVRFFPSLVDVRWTYSYGGAIAVTRDLVPQVGRYGDHTFYAHGFCGNGIACTHLSGKVLRDLILDRDGVYRSLFFVRSKPPQMPSEPLAFVGAKLVTALLMARDKTP